MSLCAVYFLLFGATPDRNLTHSLTLSLTHPFHSTRCESKSKTKIHRPAFAYCPLTPHALYKNFAGHSFPFRKIIELQNKSLKAENIAQNIQQRPVNENLTGLFIQICKCTYICS